jgi:hypothetical protein
MQPLGTSVQPLTYVLKNSQRSGFSALKLSPRPNDMHRCKLSVVVPSLRAMGPVSGAEVYPLANTLLYSFFLFFLMLSLVMILDSDNYYH